MDDGILGISSVCKSNLRKFQLIVGTDASRELHDPRIKPSRFPQCCWDPGKNKFQGRPLDSGALKWKSPAIVSDIYWGPIPDRRVFDGLRTGPTYLRAGLTKRQPDLA
mmetsp:Transcript_5477/g.12928  ORF Transcript_5477/g.12928 Transcript_5477/m.12928 type:complete len:108 (+) Transcript_5477:71-394(+)